MEIIAARMLPTRTTGDLIDGRTRHQPTTPKPWELSINNSLGLLVVRDGWGAAGDRGELLCGGHGEAAGGHRVAGCGEDGAASRRGCADPV